MAGSTRLELATSGVTGRRSNQLNYDPAREMPIINYSQKESAANLLFQEGQDHPSGSAPRRATSAQGPRPSYLQETSDSERAARRCFRSVSFSFCRIAVWSTSANWHQ